MYGTTGGVNALIPAIGDLTEISTPSAAQVEGWLDEATVMIGGTLAGAGYSVDVSEDSDLLLMLDANAQIYAAATALQARGLDSMSGDTENRSDSMFKRFYAGLKLLATGNLEPLGATLAATTRRRRIRTTQMRRIDGYSATYEGSATPYLYPSE